MSGPLQELQKSNNKNKTQQVALKRTLNKNSEIETLTIRNKQTKNERPENHNKSAMFDGISSMTVL
jgi:hypothetical protein